MNLFRMLKNSPINNRDREGGQSYDVMNEQEAMGEKRGIRLLARGLDSFPENLKEKVRGGISLAESWVAEQISALEQDQMDPYSSKLMDFTFGEDHALEENDPVGLKKQLLATMKAFKTFLSKVGGDESWRLSLVDRDNRTAAGAVHSAVQGDLIWLNRSFVEVQHLVGLGSTVAHEVFHAIMKRGSVNFISDFWYVRGGEPSAAATDDEVDDYIYRAMNSSFSRVGNSTGVIIAPSEADMAEGPRNDYIRLMNDFLRRVGEVPTTSSEEREELYQDYPNVRQAVVLRNADSLAAMLMARHRV
ncbi:hypothetical protein D3C81_1271480 [compost metagenome]